ncbi:MAG: hypothetical protein RIR39_1964 [Pseudomonadota bacterium]
MNNLLKLAIKAIIANNFSADVSGYWLTRLQSILSNTSNPAGVREYVTGKLAPKFNRYFRLDNLKKAHKGIEPFTLKELSGGAQSILQETIRKNVDKIVLSKESAELLTMNRFSSWILSGDDSQHLSKLEAHIKKPINNTDYENRRLLNDQGHKMIAAVNESIALDGGAIAMQWHQNYTHDPRVTHKRLNGKIYILKDSQPVRDGLLKSGDNPYLEDLGTMPALEVNCTCSGVYFYNLLALYRQYPSAFTKKGLEVVSGV